MPSNAAPTFQTWFALSLALMALTACTPSGEQQTAPAVNAEQLRSLQKQTCEVVLRQRMEAGSLRFVDSPFSTLTKDASVLNIGIEAIEVKERHFAVIYSNGKIAGLTAKMVSSKSDTAYVGFSSTLAPAQEAASHIFELNITLTKTARKPIATVEYQQLFGIDTDCRLKPKSFSMLNVQRSGDTLKFERQTSVLNGRPGSDTQEKESIQVPATGKLSGEMGEPQTAEALLTLLQATPIVHESGSFPIGGRLLSATLGEVNRSASLTDPIEKKTYPALEIELHLQFANQSISAKVAESSDRSVSKTSLMGSDTWTLPLTLWQRAALSGATVTAVRTVDESRSRVANENPASMQIRTTRKFLYPNLGAYWKITDHTESAGDPEGWIYSYVVSPLAPTRPKLSAPRIASPRQSGRSELLASERVQVELPEVQQFALQLMRDNPTADRADMAVKILELVNRTITYDQQSVSDWQIQPLKTSDILLRRTGVCQHYAVLFASIARAVGIPTRIVAGYALSGGPAGGHAWNEIEVVPGTWMPIEPQRTDLTFNSHMYLPMYSGGIFESESNTFDNFDAVIAMSRTEFRIRY